jgi:hypothetical protein
LCFVDLINTNTTFYQPSRLYSSDNEQSSITKIYLPKHSNKPPIITKRTIDNTKMRKSSLRQTTLLSLIGLSPRFTTAQASTTSTDNLIPRQETTSWGEAFTVDNSAVITPSSSLPTSEGAAPSLMSDSSIAPGIQSGAGRSSRFDVSVTESASATGTGSGGAAAETQSKGAAGGNEGFRKMGFVGVVAGAAGIMFV